MRQGGKIQGWRSRLDPPHPTLFHPPTPLGIHATPSKAEPTSPADGVLLASSAQDLPWNKVGRKPILPVSDEPYGGLQHLWGGRARTAPPGGLSIES